MSVAGQAPRDGADALAGARVVLGVSGGIAAYKAVEVCRRLVDAGALVTPVMTRAATRFVGVTTFSALASERVRIDLFDDEEAIPHTRLAQQADLVLVAPATAHLIAQMRAGLAPDLLSAVLLATQAPVLVCPAMHTEMWEHPAVQENLAVLAGRGVQVVQPDAGRLAGGDVGSGRLAEPAAIVEAARALLARRSAAGPGTAAATAGPLAGLRVLVTAGGTREPLDAVRFIANRSSGKQGHAIAEVALERGASVTLVSAAELAPPPGAVLRRVETAAEMGAAVAELAPDHDVVVMAAAVADFRPVRIAEGKWHKADGVPSIVLEPTDDILAGLGRTRRDDQVIVGFAAETAGEEELAGRAAAKLAAKGVDIVVANDVAAPGVGFAHDTNAVTIVAVDGSRRSVPLASKTTIAGAVLDAVAERWGDRARRGGGAPARLETGPAQPEEEAVDV